MSFIDLKHKRSQYPRRLWAVYGEANTGKSTFCATLRAPVVWVDADQRAAEIVNLVEGDLLGISDDPYDNTIPERIDGLLTANMPASQVGTIVVDSVSAILEPIVTRIQADVEAGRIKNKAGAWRPKAAAMKMLHNLGRFGTDVVMTYHEYKALDARGQWQQTRTVSQLEEARMVKSLNMLLKISHSNDLYQVQVVWARNGRGGFTLVDEAGHWRDMPERIEAAVYDDLSHEEQVVFADRPPTVFPTPAIAIAWSMHQVPCPFRDEAHAQNAYDKLKAERAPGTARAMRDLWVADVQERVAETLATNGDNSDSEQAQQEIMF